MLTVHIFTRESLYSYKFINFLYKHFDISEHFFIYRSPHKEQYEYPPSFQIKNILYIDSKSKYILKLIPLLLRSQIIYIHFEDIKFEELIDYRKLYSYILEKRDENKMTYIFLDEIQNVKYFQKAVDSLFIQKNCDIYITGSNAYMLSRRTCNFIIPEDM